MEDKSIQIEKIIFLGFPPTTTTTSTTSSTTTGLPPAPTTTTTTTPWGTTTTTTTATPTTTTTTTTSLICCTNWTGDSRFAIFGGWGSMCRVSNFVLNPVILQQYARLSECKIYVLAFNADATGIWLKLYKKMPTSFYSAAFAVGRVTANGAQTVTLRDDSIVYGTYDWNGITPTIADYDYNAYIYCP